MRLGASWNEVKGEELETRYLVSYKYGYGDFLGTF